MIVQKKVGHEPDTWEDVKIPEDCEGKAVAYLAEKYRALQVEGEHRVVLDNGRVHSFRAYPVTAWEVVVDGGILR